MGMVSKIICEKILPIPWEDFSEEETKFLNKTQWDELEFYTSSFLDYGLEPNFFSTYTITEDGQFYKNLIRIKVEKNKEGEAIYDEVPAGIERQDFTGEIHFSSAILGEEDYDYDMTFSALFYKGELKELNLEDWSKLDNKKRKAAIAEITKQLKKKPTRPNVVAYFISWTLMKVINLIKWILFWVFKIIVKIEMWISK